MKKFKTVFIVSLFTLFMTACSQEEKAQKLDTSCKISGSLAPMWVCTEDDLDEDTISAVGIGSLSGGEAFQRKVALANARSALIKHINLEKKQTLNLLNSKLINQWIEPKSKDLYILLSMPTPKNIK